MDYIFSNVFPNVVYSYMFPPLAKQGDTVMVTIPSDTSDAADPSKGTDARTFTDPQWVGNVPYEIAFMHEMIHMMLDNMGLRNPDRKENERNVEEIEEFIRRERHVPGRKRP